MQWISRLSRKTYFPPDGEYALYLRWIDAGRPEWNGTLEHEPEAPLLLVEDTSPDLGASTNRPLSSLVLQRDARVTVCGVLDDAGTDQTTLWTISPWNPRMLGPHSGSDVDVQLADGAEVPSDGIVRVDGVWTGNGIRDALIERTETPDAGHWQSKDFGVASGLQQSAETDFAFQYLERFEGRALGARRTGQGLSIEVLRVTSEIVRLCLEAPLPLEVHTAITPLRHQD